MAHVPTANITALYNNTQVGTTADPAAMDAAVADLVSTINTNYDFSAGLVSSSLVSRLGIFNVKDYNASGDGDTTTTGSITSGLKALTVASTSTFAVGQGISIAGAGAAAAALETTISAINGLVITLVDAASTTVAAAVVSHDDTAAILAAVAAITANGGGKLIIPYGIYLINNDIVLGNDTIVECYGWLKRSGTAGTYDAVFVGTPGAQNITILNPMIDCNNQPGMNGIIARRNNNNFKVLGGRLKNGVHEAGGKLGGRALINEAGSNQVENGSKRVIFDGVSITNFYMAMLAGGGDDQEGNNNIYTNIVAEDCEVLIGLFGNAAGYPHDGDSMSYIFSNITAKNCGYSTTYSSRQHGLICSDRGSNILIDGLYCFNESAYGTIGSVFKGDAKNIHMKNVVFDGNSTYVWNGYGFQESNSIVDNGYVTQNNDIEIAHNGSVTDIFGLSSSVTTRLISSEFKIRTKTVSNDRAVTSSISSNGNVLLDVYNADNNVRFQGFASDLAAGFLFSSHANKNSFGKTIRIFDANGGNYPLTANTSGQALWNSVVLSRFVGVPASAGATGRAGDWSADASYFYACHATNTWKRVAISTW